jgi:hypothetical protein
MEVLGKRGVEVLDPGHVVETIPDKDVVEAGQLRHELIVTAGVQQAADVLATQSEVDDVCRRQVTLSREQEADYVLQLGFLGGQFARNAGLGGAVAEKQDLDLALVLGA